MLVVSGKMEAGIVVVGLESNIESTLGVTDHAEKTRYTSKVLSLLVETK